MIKQLVKRENKEVVYKFYRILFNTKLLSTYLETEGCHAPVPTRKPSQTFVAWVETASRFVKSPENVNDSYKRSRGVEE